MKSKKTKSGGKNKKIKRLNNEKAKANKKIKKGKVNKVKIKKERSVKKSNCSYSLKRHQNLPLRERMLEKLKSSRFRYINEQLYKMEGKEALKYFQNDKEAFTAYHEGYQQQIQSWPKNPVDVIIKSLKELSTSTKNLVVGDFGCGDAKIAKSLPEIKVHSFDLISVDPCVTVCDMASTPLEDESLDVAVFCLSLMGTNLSEYLVESNRVLKVGGTLKLAEVASRFNDIQKFINLMSRFGFAVTSKNFSFQYFYLIDFRKERNLGKNFKKKPPQLFLKPCLYKKR